MFSGIITDIGKLKEKKRNFYTFTAPPSFYRKLAIGGSVAVNGACLTVVKKSPNIFTVDLMPETEKKTAFGKLKKNDIVNLELPATPTTFLSGHLVQGHVDGVGAIKSVEENGNSKVITIITPAKLMSHIIQKGSIAVNGISLTVIQAEKKFFTVGIIPFTWKHTMLKNAKVGDKVNIEVDVIGKYVNKLLKN